MDFFSNLLKFKRNRRAEHEYMNKHMMVMHNSQTKMQDPLKDKALYAPNVITVDIVEHVVLLPHVFLQRYVAI